MSAFDNTTIISAKKRHENLCVRVTNAPWTIILFFFQISSTTTDPLFFRSRFPPTNRPRFYIRTRIISVTKAYNVPDFCSLERDAATTPYTHVATPLFPARGAFESQGIFALAIRLGGKLSSMISLERSISLHAGDRKFFHEIRLTAAGTVR